MLPVRILVTVIKMSHSSKQPDPAKQTQGCDYLSIPAPSASDKQLQLQYYKLKDTSHTPKHNLSKLLMLC